MYYVEELKRRLTEREYQIWTGTSGLPKEKEDAYRKSWRARAGQDPRAWFAVGWLQARHETTGGEAQRALRRLRKKAVPFWARKKAAD